MQIAAEQLPAQLQRGLHTLYTIHGNEPLLVQEALDAIQALPHEEIESFAMFNREIGLIETLPGARANMFSSSQKA